MQSTQETNHTSDLEGRILTELGLIMVECRWGRETDQRRRKKNKFRHLMGLGRGEKEPKTTAKYFLQQSCWKWWSTGI